MQGLSLDAVLLLFVIAHIFTLINLILLYRYINGLVELKIMLMNLFHDTSHVLFWAFIGQYLLARGRPILGVAAFGLGALTALYMGYQITHRWPKKKEKG